MSSTRNNGLLYGRQVYKCRGIERIILVMVFRPQIIRILSLLNMHQDVASTPPRFTKPCHDVLKINEPHYIYWKSSIVF